jgi:hypothetical protein
MFPAQPGAPEYAPIATKATEMERCRCCTLLSALLVAGVATALVACGGGGGSGGSDGGTTTTPAGTSTVTVTAADLATNRDLLGNGRESQQDRYVYGPITQVQETVQAGPP